MNEDYLWDRSGRDEEIEALESLLAPLGHRRRPRKPRRSSPGLRVAAIAAAVIITTGLALWWVIGESGDAPPAPHRKYRLQGVPERASLETGEEFHYLPQGKIAGPAELTVGRLGTVAIDPGTIVRIEEGSADVHRLYLARGSLSATIQPSGAHRFQIDTPAGLSVDLGCVYRVQVGDDGTTQVRVEFGTVSFEAAGAPKVWVPAGAACQAVPGRGPSPPYWTSWKGASSMRRELIALQFDPKADPGAAAVLRNRHEQNTLPLWHLLRARSSAVRAAAFAALLEIVDSIPEGIDQEGILSGDASMLEKWRRELQIRYW